MPAPEKLTIDTPEQIALEFTLATVGSRFLAVGIDTLLQIAGFLVLVAIGAAAQWLVSAGLPPGLRTWVIGGLLLVAFTIYYGYFAFFEALWDGQTPGKRIVGLRTITASGRPITPYEAILRNVIRVADQLPGIYAIGIVSIFLTERSQRLGDLAAGTVVVHEQPIGAHGFDATTQPERGRHGAGRLTVEEIALVETFLRRRADLADVRELRAGQIAKRIRQRLKTEPTGDDEAFLEQVAAEYRASGRYH